MVLLPACVTCDTVNDKADDGKSLLKALVTDLILGNSVLAYSEIRSNVMGHCVLFTKKRFRDCGLLSFRTCK